MVSLTALGLYKAVFEINSSEQERGLPRWLSGKANVIREKGTVTVFVLTKVPSASKNPDIISVTQPVFIFAPLSFVTPLSIMQQ